MNMIYPYLKIGFIFIIVATCSCKEKIEPEIEKNGKNQIDIQQDVNLFLSSSEFKAFHETSLKLSNALKKLNKPKSKGVMLLDAEEFSDAKIENNTDPQIDSLVRTLNKQTQELLDVSRKSLPDFSSYKLPYKMGHKMYVTVLADAIKTKWKKLNSKTSFLGNAFEDDKNLNCIEINAQNTSSLIVTAIADMFLKNQEENSKKLLVSGLIHDQLNFLSCLKTKT